jgi:hypothetical protein
VTGGEAANELNQPNSANSTAGLDSEFEPAFDVCAFSTTHLLFSTYPSLVDLECFAHRDILEAISTDFAPLRAYIYLNHIPRITPKCLPVLLPPLVATTSRAIRFISASVANGM